MDDDNKIKMGAGRSITALHWHNSKAEASQVKMEL